MSLNREMYNSVEEINGYYSTFKNEINGMKPEHVVKYFKIKTNLLKEEIKFIIQNDKSKDSIEYKEQKALKKVMTKAYGLVKLACEYIIHETPYDVQILGAIALNDGYISEMGTGEGKTLTATMPAYLNALLGHGVHVITPNNYLASRDQKKMSKVYHLLGLKCGLVEEGPIDVEAIENKKRAYQADITYGSSAAFAFDYLFDSIETNKNRLVLRDGKPCYAIIDEVDEVLFDDARVPFTISGHQLDEKYALNDEEKEKQYQSLEEAVRATKLFANQVKVLRHKEYEHIMSADNRDEYEELDKKVALIVNQNTDEHVITTRGYTLLFCHYKFNEIARVLKKQNLTHLSMNEVVDQIVSGKNKVLEQMFDEYSGKDLITEYDSISKAIMAWYIVKKDKDYTMKRNENREYIISPVVNGRTADKRKYSNGLQQAIEIKERMLNPIITIAESKINDTLASIPPTSFFGRYYKLSGMTGTSLEEPMKEMYGLYTYKVPPHRPKKTVDRGDVYFDSPTAKYNAIFKEVFESYKKGQPVLITTTSIAKSESLARFLEEKLHSIGLNIHIPVLNANVNKLAEEASIISKAGEPGAITISTEMAGRGTDIKLGGEYPTISESRRDVITYYINEKQNNLGRPLTDFERKEIINAVDTNSRMEQIVIATNRAQREKINQRKQMVVNAGGLKIIGSGHFKFTRIDNQVKGRCGRQGDVGEIIFFSDPSDLAEIGVPRKYVGALGRVAIDNPYEENKGKKLSISSLIRKAQRQAEDRQYLGIKAEQDFDAKVLELRNEVFEEAQRAKKEDNYMPIMERYIRQIATRIVMTTTPKGTNLSQNISPQRAKIDAPKLTEFTRKILGVLIEEDDIQACSSVKEMIDIISGAAMNRLKDMNSKNYRPATNKEIKRRVDQSLSRVWSSFEQMLERIKEQYNVSAMTGIDPKNNIKNYINLAFDYCFEGEIVNLLSSILNVHYGEEGKYITELRELQISPSEVKTIPKEIEEEKEKGRSR